MLPIIIRRKLSGRNATNWPGLVILGKGVAQPAATLAQEVRESRWKLNPLNLAARLMSDSARRDMEIMGHEVEVQAAVLIYGADEDATRAREAGSMLRGYDGLFNGYSRPGLILAMLGCRSAARKWVDRNKRLLSRYR